MTQSLKCRLKDLGSTPRTHLKISRGSDNTCNLGEVETGKPLVHW